VIDEMGEVPRARHRYAAQSEAEREAAFQRLTQARLERAYRLASILLRDQSEAEDAVHDAAVRAWQRWDDLRDQAAFDAWFDRIVVSCCRDRARRRLPNSIELLGIDPAARDEPGQLAAERDGLRRALAALDPTIAPWSSCATSRTCRCRQSLSERDSARAP
jgi:DNA-directed RNA polymerase specialized sigma24 family protein